MKVKMTTEQTQWLLDAIAATFGNERFDTTSIICAADSGRALDLANAIDAIIPHARYRSGYNRGNFRVLALHRVIDPWGKKHFDTDELGWWSIRNPHTVPDHTDHTGNTNHTGHTAAA
jgi:hypothetical protein